MSTCKNTGCVKKHYGPKVFEWIIFCPIILSTYFKSINVFIYPKETKSFNDNLYQGSFTPEVIPFPVSNYSFSFKTHSVIQIVNLFIRNKRNSTIICSVQEPSFSFFSILIFSILVTPLLPTTGLTKEFPLAPSRYISCT